MADEKRNFAMRVDPSHFRTGRSDFSSVGALIDHVVNTRLKFDPLKESLTLTIEPEPYDSNIRESVVLFRATAVPHHKELYHG